MLESPLESLSGHALSHMLLLLINIIFMLGCQQTIENNTKYLVIPWVFPFCFQPLSRYRNILCLASCSRYFFLPPSGHALSFPLGLVPEILCIFIIVLLSLFRVFVFLLPRESETSSSCGPRWETAGRGSRDLETWA